MGKVITTDWGSYIIEEDRVEEFKTDAARITEVDYGEELELWDKEFEEKWGDFKIIPA